MPFIGNQPALSYTSFAKQDFTTSATTSYALSQPVANENEIALFINFVRQEPTTAYTASGTTLTLTSATSATDDMYCVFLGKAVQTVNPPAGSVGLSQLSATGTKDSTTFLRGDNSFAAVSSDYVLLATTIASSVASVSFDGYFSSTYTNYEVIISDVRPVSANVRLYSRLRRSNADVTTSNYSSAGRRTHLASVDVNDGRFFNNAAEFDILTNSSPASSSRTTGSKIIIYNPLSTTSYKKVNFQSMGASDDGGGTNALWNINQAGQLTDNTNALSGISFFYASGNISEGVFKLYGIK
jgi:hypothetical protein